MYKVKVQLKTNYGDVKKEIQILLMQNEEVYIKLESIDLNITSNFNDSKVFINGDGINKKIFSSSQKQEENMFLTNMELVGAEWVIKRNSKNLTWSRLRGEKYEKNKE